MRGIFLALTTIAALGATAHAGSFEDAVRNRWRGAWVVLEIESYSACDAGYTANDVAGKFVASRGARHFDAGELVKVGRVQVRRKQVELSVTVASRVLVHWAEGPFTLYDERHCGLELQVAAPRASIQGKAVQEIDRLLSGVATRFATVDEARNSELWNGREDDDYPEDYGLTVARHARWKAIETNLAIERRIAVSLESVDNLARRVEENPVYLAGFAAGTRQMSGWAERACPNLLAGAFEVVRLGAPELHGTDEAWCEGWYDGQQLVWSIAIARRLPACVVQVPPEPQPAAEARR